MEHATCACATWAAVILAPLSTPPEGKSELSSMRSMSCHGGLWLSYCHMPFGCLFACRTHQCALALTVCNVGSAQKSPPLRRGKVGGKSRAPREQMVLPVGPSDPGMVGAFTKAASPPAEAATSGDLLDMDSLSIADPAPGPAPPQASSNGYLQDLQPSFSAGMDHVWARSFPADDGVLAKDR